MITPFYMKIVSILNNNSYIHILYNDSDLIAFDVSDAETIELAQICTFEKEFYLKSELESLNKQKKRKVKYVFSTHHHFDQNIGIDKIKAEKKIIGSTDNKIKKTNLEGNPDKKTIHFFFYEEKCKDMQRYEFGDTNILCLSTPSHTRDSFSFYINNRYLITGDTLFYLGVGKNFEGDVEDIILTIDKLKENIDDDAICLYAHNYKRENLEFAEKYINDIPNSVKEKNFLTFREEKKYNPFFNVENLGMAGDRKQNLLELRNLKNDISGKEQN